MANRRMFSLSVVDTDMFLDMPATTQALYFHLGMRADDDGFVASPKKIVKLTNCGNDDLKLLVAKGYVIPLESGIVVIKHWKINNHIRNDRYRETVYQEEKIRLTEKKDKSYTLDDSGMTFGIPCDNQTVYQMDTQYRLGKDRLGQDSIDYQLIADMYNNTCVSFPRITKLSDSRKKAIRARVKVYSLDDFEKLFQMAEESSFLKGQNNRNWSANFDWLLKDSNMAKVLDGNYQDKQQEMQQATGDVEEPDYYKYVGNLSSPDDPFQ